MSEAAVELRDVGKRYRLYSKPGYRAIDALGGGWLLRAAGLNVREIWAARHINFRVERGERVGLIGRNGAGKSTTLKLVIGTLTPTEGSVHVRGRIQALMEIGTGFHPEFTGRQNIRASLSYQGLSNIEAKALEPSIIDFSELAEFIDQPVKTYSAGMYARLAFSTATAVAPDILVIDEILGAGDAYFAGKCLERMQELTEKAGSTVLFVSHDASAVQVLCQRCIWIERGSVREDGATLPVLKAYATQVRRDEDLRLRARDVRARADGATLQREEDLLLTTRVRLRARTGDASPLRVSRLALASENGVLGEISVGGPMDNDPSKPCHLVEDATESVWGAPRIDPSGSSRDVLSTTGAQAVLALPRHELQASAALRLEIAASGAPGVWEACLTTAGEERLLGSLSATSAIESLEVPRAMLVADAASLLSGDGADHTNYGSGGCVIERVEIEDAESPDAKILSADKPCRVKMWVHSSGTVGNPVFVFCAYLPSGLCAMQLVVSGEEMGASEFSGEKRVDFVIEKLLLGAGEYVASVAVFKTLPKLGAEPEAYHVMDRCVHFKIEDDAGPAKVERGVCRQPFKAEIHAG